MKKVIFALMLSGSLSVFAQSAEVKTTESLDLNKILRAAGYLAGYIGQGLEQVRLASQQNPNIQAQWDLACDATKKLNPVLLDFNKLLTENKVNDKLCAPITPLIKFQADIIANCNNFYNKPVPENGQLVLRKFAITVFQSKLILTKCYPALAKVKLPIPRVN